MSAGVEGQTEAKATRKRPGSKAKTFSRRPMPEPGKRFVLFRPPSSHTYHASIVMQDGYKEDFPTKKGDPAPATIAASQRVRLLYKERGIESPAEKRRKAGQLSEFQLRRRERGITDGRRRKPAKNEEDEQLDDAPEASVESDSDGASSDAKWERHILRTETQYARSWLRVNEMLLLRLDNNPKEFVEHVRAIAVRTVQGVRGRGG